MCLTQRSHLLRKGFGFAQFLQHQTTRLALSRSPRAEFLVSLVKMLRQLFDDFRLPLGTQSEPGEMRVQMLPPVRHGLLR